MNSSIHKQLHTLEEDIIQTNGLLKVLQKVSCDDGAEICVVHAMECRLKILESNFYNLWHCVCADDSVIKIIKSSA